MHTAMHYTVPGTMFAALFSGAATTADISRDLETQTKCVCRPMDQCAYKYVCIATTLSDEYTAMSLSLWIHQWNLHQCERLVIFFAVPQVLMCAWNVQVCRLVPC